MVKVKEFCCGCTLRTGTLILAWIVLTLNCINFVIYVWWLSTFFRQDKKNPPNNNSPSLSSLIYFITETITAIVISITTIWTIQKKKAKYLNGLYWYFCYVVIICIVDGILVIFDPTLEQELAADPELKEIGLTPTDSKILFVMFNVLLLALAAYFALVVKSTRDYALRNEVQSKNFEGPDPTIVGYINQV